MGTTNSDLEVRVSGKDDLSPELNKLESRLIRFVGAIGAGIAAIRIGTAPIASAVNFERELANVTKTTNFANSQIRELRANLLEMSTQVDVSAQDLAKIAAAAGQQGLGKEGVAGITKFTDSVSRMSSVLDVTAEKAASDVGKIANVFKIPLNDIEKAISTFNEVSNNSTAKGEELLDVVKRIGDAAGSLNLSQATALGATGLDLGLSPEVVGTSFSKIFSSLSQKAGEMGRLVYGSTKGATDKWLKEFRTDGIAAFQDVLKSLRTLEPQAQQNAIVKLFGGGRIGTLMNKLVQDTTDSVLQKNIDSAIRGETGLSALREQATVLNTFKAQGQLTLNALTKAGIDASDQIIGDLTKYVIRLREAVESPSFTSFVNALFRGFGEVAKAAATAVEFVAKLNVNWENFLPVVTAFLGLRLSESLVKMSASALGLGGALKSISTTGAAATTAIAATGKAATDAATSQLAAAERTKASRLAELLGYKELYDAIQRNKLAKEEYAAAMLKASTTEQAALAASSRADLVSSQTRSSAGFVQDKSQEVSQARSVVQQRLAAAAQEAAAIEQRKQASIASTQQQSQARMLAIEQEYQAQRAAIAATGTQTGLKVARAERAALLEEEQTRLTRSLTGIESYWSRRAAVAATGAKAEIEAARLAYLNSAQVFDSAYTSLQKQNRNLSYANAADAEASGKATAAAAAAAAAAKLNPVLSGQATLMDKLSNAWTSFSLVLRTGGSILATTANLVLSLGSKFLSVFSWVTLIYSIADAFGLIDKLGPILTRFTDAIGLTSAANRKAAVEAEAAKKRLDEEATAVANLTKRYDDLAARKTTKEFQTDVQSLGKQAATAPTSAARATAVDALSDNLIGAKNALDQTGEAVVSRVGARAAQIEANAKNALARYQELKAKMDKEIAAASSDSEVAAIRSRLGPQVALVKATYDDLAARMDATQGKTKSLSAAQEEANANYKATAEVVASMFTPESLKLLETYALRIKDLKDKADGLREAYAKESKPTGTSKQSLDSTTAVAQDQIVALENEARSLSAKMKEDILALQKTAENNPALQKALADIPGYVERPAASLRALIAAAKSVPSVKLTGENAGSGAATASSGDSTFTNESAAKKLARARVALAKAELDARLSQEEEANKQLESLNQYNYEQGLKSLSAYLEEKKRIETASIDAEIARNRQLISSVRAESGGIQDPAQLTTFQAEIKKLEGQISVLQLRKKGLTDETARTLSKGTADLDAAAAERKAGFERDSYLPADAVTIYQDRLAAIVAANKVAWAKMRAEGKGADADMQQQAAAFQAYNDAVAPSQAKYSNTMSQITNLKTQLQQLQADGQITSVEADQQLTKYLANAKTALEGYLKTQEEMLGAMDAVKDTPAFKKLQIDIAATRLQIQGLSSDMNTTARSINSSFEQSISTLLQTTDVSLSGLRTALLNFVSSIAKSIQQVFATNIAQTVVKGLGSGGSGGLGGFVSGMLGQKTNDGSSSSQPMYTKEVSTIPGIDTVAENTSQQAIGIAALPGKIGGFFSGLGASMWGGIQFLWQFLTTAFGTLTTAVLTGDAVSSTTSSIATMATVAAVVAHTGGIIGQSSMVHRSAVPGMFVNAARYHTGGIVGLKPNEVPIIANKGEEVITESDPRHANNQSASSSSGTGAATTLNVWVVSPDQQPSVGPNDIIATVADNISRGGSIKKLIQSVTLKG